MVWQSDLARALAVTPLAVVPGIVHAAPCFQLSPGLAELGDACHDLHEAPKLTQVQEAALRAFAERIDGAWHREGASIDCRGTERAPRPGSRAFEIELAVSTFVQQPLRPEERRKVERTGSTSLALTVLFDKASGAEILKVAKNDLLIIEKYRRATGFEAGTGRRLTALWEVIHEFGVRDRQPSCSTTCHVNGHLASADARRFRRR